MFSFLAPAVDELALLIAVGCFIFPVVVLAFVAFAKVMIKHVNRNRKIQPDEIDPKTKYLSLFGDDNIETISKEMTRVTVQVKDLELVNYQGLRELGVGVLIAGNTIKCSSQEFANLIEN